MVLFQELRISNKALGCMVQEGLGNEAWEIFGQTQACLLAIVILIVDTSVEVSNIATNTTDPGLNLEKSNPHSSLTAWSNVSKSSQ